MQKISMRTNKILYYGRPAIPVDIVSNLTYKREFRYLLLHLFGLHTQTGTNRIQPSLDLYRPSELIEPTNGG